MLVSGRAWEAALSHGRGRARGWAGVGPCLAAWAVLWGARGLLELINSCCRCDIPLEKRKQPARLKTCFPSLMHPPGPLPVISPSALHQGIACFSNSVLMDFPYPHARAFERGKEGRHATMPAASGRAGQPALLELLLGQWARRAHYSPQHPARAQHHSPSAAADRCGWRGLCPSFAGRPLARLAAREQGQPGEAVPSKILGQLGRRWERHCPETDQRGAAAGKRT